MAKIPNLVMADEGMDWGRWAQQEIVNLRKDVELLQQNLGLALKAIEAIRGQL